MNTNNELLPNYCKPAVSRSTRNKRLMYQLSDGADASKIVMTLSAVMEWIEGEEDGVTPDDDKRCYTIVPIWLTDRQIKRLPEASI